MMVLTAFTKGGGLAAHLLRRDTNKEVSVRDDLFRGTPYELDLALRTFIAVSQTNCRAKKHFVHVKISPEIELEADQLARTLEVFEIIYGIPPDHPRVVVAHAKGERPRHYHVVYSHVHPETGRAVSSKASFAKDEAVSRVAELEFGHPFNPGAHPFGAAKRLAEVGLSQYVPFVRGASAASSRDRQSKNEMRAASARSIDRRQMEDGAFAAWLNGPHQTLQDRLPPGLVLAQGRHAVLLVNLTQGWETALHRTINAASKRAGQPQGLTALEMRELFPNLPAWDSSKSEIFQAEVSRANAALSAEWRVLGIEADIDGERSIAQSAKKRGLRQRTVLDRQTLKALRAAIVSSYRERARVRRLRVRRAYRAARIVSTFRLRRIAFMMAGTGILMAGGGLGLALVAAGCLAAALPSFERARTLSRHAALEQQHDHEQRAAHLVAAASLIRPALKPVRWEEELEEVEPWYARRRKGPRTASLTSQLNYGTPSAKADGKKLGPLAAYRVRSSIDHPVRKVPHSTNAPAFVGRNTRPFEPSAVKRAAPRRASQISAQAQNATAVPKLKQPFAAMSLGRQLGNPKVGPGGRTAKPHSTARSQDSWRYARFESKHPDTAHKGEPGRGITD